MYTYQVFVQFANPSAEFERSMIPVIDGAIEYYNQRSLTAKNPKKILEKEIIDAKTLKLILESEAQLPFPGKALQVFTRYLINSETEGSLNSYIYGSQLFNMQAAEISCDSQALRDDERINTERIKAISLILSAKPEVLRSVIRMLQDEVLDDK